MTFMMLAISLTGMAQGIEMADIMRSNGKIYVVVAVVAVILAGLILYLVRLDYRIAALERKIKKGN